jgi:hypothetical protein
VTPRELIAELQRLPAASLDWPIAILDTSAYPGTICGIDMVAGVVNIESSLLSHWTVEPNQDSF